MFRNTFLNEQLAANYNQNEKSWTAWLSQEILRLFGVIVSHSLHVFRTVFPNHSHGPRSSWLRGMWPHPPPAEMA